MAAEEAAPPLAPARLAVHETVLGLQQQYGVRQNDFVRYRRFTTRRLRRVRKGLQFTYGRGRTYTPREVLADEISADPAHLLIPLLNAERAWAFAMEIKQEMARGERSSKLARLAVGRLAKAAKWSGDLERLCAMCADERTRLEANAYGAWMAGSLLMEREQWTAALERFATAHQVCEELSRVGSIEQQDLFTQRAEEIGQSIRYCKYNSGEDVSAEALEALQHGAAGELLRAQLDSVLKEAEMKEARTFTTLSWRSHTLALRSDELRVAVLRARELDAELEGTETREEAQYSKVINAHDEALDIVAAQAAELAGMAAGVKVDAQRSELDLLRGYLSHVKLMRMFERNQNLAQALRQRWRRQSLELDVNSGETRPEDIAHLYEALLQILQDVAKLPGVVEDDEMVDTLQAREAATRATRCFFLAEAYSANGQLPEALALYDHAAGIAADAADALAACEDVDQDLADVEELRNEVAGAKSRAQAQAFLNTKKEASGLADDAPAAAASAPTGLLQRLLSYDAGTDGTSVKLAEFPPAFETVPCKPLLFDVAHNYLEFPNLDSKAGIAPRAEEGGGLFSWLRGGS